MQKQTVVIVVGMHRSGTSAITRALSELGVDLGTTLQPGAPDNLKGYWEDLDIVALNERLLETLGSRWHGVSPIPRCSLEGPEVSKTMLEALQLVREKLKGRPVWGFKDPRTARLLPFWKAVLQRTTADIRYLITCRSPISVARSLAKRDGFAAEKSYLLWLQHVIPAMSETSGASRVVVDYDNMLASPERELRRIGAALDLQPLRGDGLGIGEYTEAFLDADLRHAVFSASDLSLDCRAARLVREANELLQALARDEKQVTDPHVVASWEEMSKALEDLAPFAAYLERRELDLERLQAQVGCQGKQLTHFGQSVVKRDSRIAALDAALHERDSRIAALDAALHERDSRIAALEATLLQRDAEIKATEAIAGGLRTQVSNLTLTVQQFQTSTSWRVTAPLRALRNLWSVRH